MAALVDVYPYRLGNSLPEFLILKRSDNKPYAGQWGIIAGKVDACETSWQGGLRELREETGAFPKAYWSVPSLNQFYEPKKDTIHHIPVFTAEVSADKQIKLNKEHTDNKWVEIEQINTFISWPEQRRLINAILTTQNILDEWKIPL